MHMYLHKRVHVISTPSIERYFALRFVQPCIKVGCAKEFCAYYKLKGQQHDTQREKLTFSTHRNEMHSMNCGFVCLYVFRYLLRFVVSILRREKPSTRRLQSKTHLV